MKIKLRTDSSSEVESWQNELNRSGDEVRETLKAEGVSLEAVFLDSQSDGDYLIYVMRSDDFERAADVASRSAARVDRIHRAFKARCWEDRVPLPSLIDFEVHLPPE